MPDDPGVHNPQQPPQPGPQEPAAPLIRSQSPDGGPMRATDATSPPVNRYTQPGAPLVGQPAGQPVAQETYSAPPNLPAPPADAYPPGGYPFQDPNSPGTFEEALTRPSDLDIFV